MLGFIFVVHCIWSFQVHRLNFTSANISRFWSILGILETFAMSVYLFYHPFGGRDSLVKKRNIPRFILQTPPNLHPFVLEGLVRTKTFFTLLLGVDYSVSKSESSSSSEVRNYDHHRWETNK